MTKFAIAYITGRDDPRLDWLVDGISDGAHPNDEITLIVIDQLAAWDKAREIRQLGFRETSAIQRAIHAAPKPNPWSGPHRITSREWWSKSNSANTAIVLCPPDVDYIVFMDDRSKLGPHWFEAVRKGNRERKSVLAGAYERIETIDGQAKITHDHRRKHFPQGKTGCPGGWCYGCTIALPMAWALEVNGFEEGCDSLTGEDYTFGLMLANRGYRIDYSTDLFITIDRTAGNASCKGAYACTDKGKSPNDKSHAALKRFGGRSRTDPALTPDLRSLRALWHVQKMGDGTWPRPDPNMRDWFDDQLVREMQPPP
jgi:hypothetical protein